MNIRALALDYLSRFCPEEILEDDLIAFEAIVEMAIDHGKALAEWGNEEPTIRDDVMGIEFLSMKPAST